MSKHRQTPHIRPVGDAALLIEYEERVDLQVNRAVHAADQIINQRQFPGFIESIPAYRSLLVQYNPDLINYEQLVDLLNDLLAGINPDFAFKNTKRLTIPTIYGGKYGPDLAYVAEFHSLSVQQVIERHTAREYPVYMMGFTPGFPYLGGMDSEIATPRLVTPRTHVPAGSVGIAESQTGIYPIGSPGGWRIIGYTPLKLYDPERSPPFLVSPGDVLVFESIPEEGITYVV